MEIKTSDTHDIICWERSGFDCKIHNGYDSGINNDKSRYLKWKMKQCSKTDYEEFVNSPVYCDDVNNINCETDVICSIEKMRVPITMPVMTTFSGKKGENVDDWLRQFRHLLICTRDITMTISIYWLLHF